MRILKYKDFILEKIIPQPTDTTEEDSTVNRLNDMEKDINDFNKFKNEVETIYKNAKDSEDLNSTEQMKVSVRFLNNEVRSDSLEINVYKKVCETADKCKTIKITNNFPNQLKENILSVARLMKIEEAKKEKK
jgi:hypothetical protein